MMSHKSGPIPVHPCIAKQTLAAAVTGFFFCRIKNAKETAPCNLSNFTFISCGHFNEMIFGIPLKMRVELSRQNSGVGRGWLPIRKI